MIPQRVKLSGFLSYKEEQEIPFRGGSVWMLAGLNGSGKSSVFDAVTYALFGHHRGGSQNASELINKESNALTVEFDFLLDHVLYRIRRTLKRSARGSASGTQQIFRDIGTSPDEPDWEAVPDTNKKVDFDSWIHEHIGLNYETFTSSVLLLQGKAEKLLDSKPSGRAEVLAGIVDLERYQRLHERANQKKLALKGQLDSLSHQWAAVPEVTELDYAMVLEAIDRASDDRELVTQDIDRLLDREIQARKWTESQTRLNANREKLKVAESLLGTAVKIERDHARMMELKDVLPAVQAVVTMRAKVQESELRTKRLMKDRDDALERKRFAEENLQTVKKKRDSLRNNLAAHEQKYEEFGKRLRELAGLLQSVRHAEDQESQVQRIHDDLARLPKNPDADVKRAQDEVDELSELTTVLPVLQRVHDERAELKSAQQKLAETTKNLDRLKKLGESKKTTLAQLTSELTTAREARTKADARLTEARTLAAQAKELAAEFQSLEGQKSCRACGQALTPDHFAKEKQQREREAKAAEKRVNDAINEQLATVAREQELTASESEMKAELEQLRETYRDADMEKKQTSTDITRHLRELKIRYAELPEHYRIRISPSEPNDWCMTKFPQRDEMSTLTHQASGLDAAKRKLRSAQDTHKNWTQLQTRLATVTESLAKLKAMLPTGDLLALRAEQSSKQSEETSLANTIKSIKATISAADTEIDKFGREVHFATTTLTELTGKLSAEEMSRDHCLDIVDREMKKLPSVWQTRVQKAGMSEHHEWESEYQRLVGQDTDALYRKLQVARGGLDAIRETIRVEEAESATFPDECRLSPDAVKVQISDARKKLAEKDNELRAAQQRKSVYDGHREQRSKLGDAFKKADAEFNRYKLLSELLGRDRLQRHLVRQAERQIVDYANAVLDRLSGGELFLKLVGGGDDGADRALDLECANRVAGGAPINVMFLSGSQKFRVAVSLALGIGQYASRQHRPIESVIIDEGFGCLDRQGRQVMIQELQNLRGHLHCILLVSHQDEFADAFPDGYRFELHNGATKVSRFRR